MSVIATKLCSLIIQEHFGETVKTVCNSLYGSKYKSVTSICHATKLSRRQVTVALATLVQHGLVTFVLLESNENLAEYKVDSNKIILLLRFPRYVHFTQKKYGNPSALLVEQMLKSGMETAEAIVIRAYDNSETKNDQVLKELRDAFVDMYRNNYIIRATSGVLEAPSSPSKQNKFSELEAPPNLDLKELKTAIEGGVEPTSNIYWAVNFDRFHQSFRDKILVDTIERQFDANAGECFQCILQIMYKRTEAWPQRSNPIAFSEIKQTIERKSQSLELVKFVDQYVTLIERSECGFLNKCDEAGLYVVDMKTAFSQIAWGHIENVITQKFGSKATRIFRLVRLRKFIEQEDIQKEAMIPGKEAKFLTYRLLEENFLQLQTVKKTGSGGTAHKAFYLFKVNQYHIVLMLIETCYKALFNSMTRSMQEKEGNKRLMEKAMRLQFIVDGMRARNESDEMIQEINETLTPPEKEIVEKTKFRLKRLESSEVVIDEMLLMLQLFIRLQSPPK